MIKKSAILTRMEAFIPYLGLLGSIIFTSAYIPQIWHLVKIKDSTGISITSWAVWLLGALLMLAYAVFLRDIVFLLLTILESVFLFTTIILAVIYRKKV